MTRRPRLTRGMRHPPGLKGEVVIMPEICQICYAAYKAGDECRNCKPTNPKGTKTCQK